MDEADSEEIIASDDIAPEMEDTSGPDTFGVKLRPMEPQEPRKIQEISLQGCTESGEDVEFKKKTWNREKRKNEMTTIMKPCLGKELQHAEDEIEKGWGVKRLKHLEEYK